MSTSFLSHYNFIALLRDHDADSYDQILEKESWTSKLKAGGKYYLTRNGSGLIAFSIGTEYKSGDGVAMIAGHIDALTAKLKPVSKKDNKSGYVQLGVAQYGGALNETWWDRDLGVGGRVLVKRSDGKVESLVVKIDHPSESLIKRR